MVITERQKIEMENLMENANKEQAEAVIAYTEQTYIEGLIKGAITGAVGFGLGVAIGITIQKIKNIHHK